MSWSLLIQGGKKYRWLTGCVEIYTSRFIMTGYVVLKRSTAVATARSWSTFEGTLSLLGSLALKVDMPILKVDVPILPCVFYTFNWLTLTSEMYFVRFHPEVTSCLLSRGKTKYATLGMRLWCKYIRNYLLVYQLTSHFLLYLRNYKEFEGEISDLQLEKYRLSFETKKYTTSIWARGGGGVRMWSA